MVHPSVESMSDKSPFYSCILDAGVLQILGLPPFSGSSTVSLSGSVNVLPAKSVACWLKEGSAVSFEQLILMIVGTQFQCMPQTHSAHNQL